MVNDTEIIHDLWPLCGIVIRDRLCWCVQSNYNLVQTADGWFKASHHGKGWWQAAKQPLPSRLRWKLTGQNLFLSFLFSIVLGELVTIKYYKWLTMTITHIHTYSLFNFGTPPLVFPLHGRAPWLMPWPWWQLVLATADALSLRCAGLGAQQFTDGVCQCAQWKYTVNCVCNHRYTIWWYMIWIDMVYIYSYNHTSPAFASFTNCTRENHRQFLVIPSDYAKVVFQRRAFLKFSLSNMKSGTGPICE